MKKDFAESRLLRVCTAALTALSVERGCLSVNAHTSRPELSEGTPRAPEDPSFGLRPSLWIAITFAILLGASRILTLGDTPNYAVDIVGYLGRSPVGRGNSLWEFGHLIWRPVGWVVASITSPILSRMTDWTPYMQVIFVLLAISAICGVVTVVLWYRILVDITCSRAWAAAVALAMSCSNGFLLYTHSGCSYVAGLMFCTSSLYLLLRNRIGTATVCYVLSVLLWLPFILAGPALVLIALWPGSWATPLREIFRSIKAARAVRFIVLAAALIAVSYGLGAGARRVSSIQEAKVWYSQANHGWSQSIRGIRIATGLPRSLLYLGNDGIRLKRYIRGDPYARMTIPDLIKASLWKIAVFDLFLVCLIYDLFTRGPSRWPLLVLLVACGPVVLFAVFLFEPGSPERYLPALPFLILAIGWVLRDFAKCRRVTQVVVAGFLMCILLNNGYSFAAPRVSAGDSATRARLAGLRARLTGGGIAVLVTYQDDIADLVNRSPFDDLNRPGPFPIYDAIEPATVRVPQWRQEFATRVFAVWDRGGEVWMSKRFWNRRPQPEWNWVEGDDRRVTWPELPQFVSGLHTDEDLGGPDGFRRLARDEDNRAWLTPLALQYRSSASENAPRN